ncbi:uncharacterized protein EAF01_007219 [Botrytis porri]|uniref:uncharacterized protein n=1 Tax=Botrytis porri TaxID=87229 RepID=UPI0019009975|nr:uncharacterized protein EAF01_007219 [Botrytis porri]KAF7901921.1 hypothetical protein EAF01_007219 [Botrytis porri]
MASEMNADLESAVVRQFSSVDKLAWLPVAFLLAASGKNLFWRQIVSPMAAVASSLLMALFMKREKLKL